MSASSPRAATDVIVELSGDRVVLVRRKHAPLGWALPGGFIDEGERAEAAAVREVFEETGLTISLAGLLSVYSDPSRDPRGHTLSVVYFARAEGEPVGGDDAAEAQSFSLDALPSPLAFDHRTILDDYIRFRTHGERPLDGRCLSAAILSADERVELLTLARAAIDARLRGESPPTITPRGALAEPFGVFVSLHQSNGDLRGCIGTLARDRPLADEIPAMAEAAAFDDPRFEPLQPEELADLDIEISVLSPAVRATPAEVVAGVHGVAISRGGRKAVFLPQVAREAGWGRDRLLSELCRKAGLEADAWRDPETALSIFTAAVFSQPPADGRRTSE
jgi:8-oxo-dGTP diphosphatase